MIKIAVEMPEVKTCEASQCVYNVSQSCNARAITVGDGTRPGCDTFGAGSPHARNRHEAGVGACKVSNCRYNDDYECQADAISVGVVNNAALCTTYEAR